MPVACQPVPDQPVHDMQDSWLFCCRRLKEYQEQRPEPECKQTFSFLMILLSTIPLLTVTYFLMK